MHPEVVRAAWATAPSKAPSAICMIIILVMDLIEYTGTFKDNNEPPAVLKKSKTKDEESKEETKEPREEAKIDLEARKNFYR